MAELGYLDAAGLQAAKAERPSLASGGAGFQLLPRYTVILTLPYDRPNTTMKAWPFDDYCDREYHDAANRRFHAQPNACSRCGPHLEYWDDSGHVLGSTIWEFIINDAGQTKRIAFPGDIGNPPSLLLHDIDYVHNLDYTLVESAYGDRIHEAREQRRTMLLDALQTTHTRGGVLMIPSFAVERTQELLLEMDTLFEAGKLPKMPVFVDSPLAIKITEVYGRFSNLFNDEAQKILRDNRGLFQFPWLSFTPSVMESKHINDVPNPKVIIAGSGMSQGGRILHHELRYLSDPRSMILFVGYQVQGSLGRRIKDGEKTVTIFGTHVPVKCHVSNIGAYSAHADQNGLIEYIRQCAVGGKLKECFVVQGEETAAQTLADRAATDLGVHAVVPRPGESFTL